MVQSVSQLSELLYMPTAITHEWVLAFYLTGVPPAGASQLHGPILTQWLSVRPWRSRGAPHIPAQPAAQQTVAASKALLVESR